MPYPSPTTYPGPTTFPGFSAEPAPPTGIDATVGALIPHFIMPFRFAHGAASVVEQDTSDDVLVCVLAILLCPKGYRAELPDFGMEDVSFRENEPDLNVIASAIAEWEPRADALLTTERDRLDELVHHVAVRLGTRSGD